MPEDNVDSIVLALQITEESYSSYLALPFSVEHYEYEAIAGNYIVLASSKEWGIADEEAFELTTVPIEPPLPKHFTRYLIK